MSARKPIVPVVLPDRDQVAEWIHEAEAKWVAENMPTKAQVMDAVVKNLNAAREKMMALAVGFTVDHEGNLKAIDSRKSIVYDYLNNAVQEAIKMWLDRNFSSEALELQMLTPTQKSAIKKAFASTLKYQLEQRAQNLGVDHATKIVTAILKEGGDGALLFDAGRPWIGLQFHNEMIKPPAAPSSTP